MTSIGLLSDTHGYFDPAISDHFSACDEIWHAGDIGSVEVLDRMRETGKTLRPVFGNIDDRAVRSQTEEDLWFQVEAKLVFMTHIGGYPGRYNRRILPLLNQRQPDIFICGHSHILKVMYDKTHDLLHINPGAAGHHGLHAVRTVIRFTIDRETIDNLQVIELGKRGKGTRMR